MVREKGRSETKTSVFRSPPSGLIKALYQSGLAPIIGRFVLLLTTTGRRTGLPRVTPLQYEELDGAFYVGSARGTKADWFQNIVADRRVKVRIGSREFAAVAEPVTDPCRIADFLELRLKRHPTMIGAILRSEGLPAPPSRLDLEEYARRSALAIIRPIDPPPEGG